MDDVDYGWPTDADGIIRMSGGILMNINLRQPQAHDTMFVSGTGQATKLEQLEEGRMAWTVDQVVYIGSHKPYEEMTHPGGPRPLRLVYPLPELEPGTIRSVWSSRIHFPASLGSTEITPLHRYYGRSDSCMAGSSSRYAGMNTVTNPCRSPCFTCTAF